MNDQEDVVYQLDTLTRSTRFIASIGPRCATRVSLGVALGMEDAATDPAGILLGIKLRQGASALAFGIGSIASSVREGVRSKATQLGSQAGALPAVPGVEKTRDFVTQVATELRDSWASAGDIAVQADEPHEAVAPVPTVASDSDQSMV